MANQVAASANAVKKSWRDLQKFGCAYGRNGMGVLVTVLGRVNRDGIVRGFVPVARATTRIISVGWNRASEHGMLT
jgi:DNA-binding transcriptional regulator YhcF (GntR family)